MPNFRMKANYPIQRYNINTGELFGLSDVNERNEMVSSGLATWLDAPPGEKSPKVVDEVETKDQVAEDREGDYETKDQKPKRGRPRGRTARISS